VVLSVSLANLAGVVIDDRPDARNANARNPGARNAAGRSSLDSDDDSAGFWGIPTAVLRSRLGTAAWLGAGSAVLGALACVLVVLSTWFVDPSHGSAGSTVRAGVIAFLVGQHGGARIDGVNAAFVPLGLTLFAAWVCWRGVGLLRQLRWLHAGVSMSTPSNGLTGRRSDVDAVVFVGAFGITCGALTIVGRVGTSGVSVVPTVFGALALCAVVCVARLGPELIVVDRVMRVVPAMVGDCLRAGIVAAATFVAAGAALVGVSLLVHGSRVTDLSDALAGGLGGVPVLLLGMLCAPNAVLAGSAYLAGPGFSVGAGTSVSVFGSSLGPVPAFPLLGALPDGSSPGLPALALAVLTIVGAGVLAGRSAAARVAEPTWLSAGTVAAGSGLVAGVLLGVVTGLAGGSVGAGRMRVVGASAWRVAAAVTVEVGVIATVCAIATVWWGAHRVSGDVADRQY
jgi:hypothetical protein